MADQHDPTSTRAKGPSLLLALAIVALGHGACLFSDFLLDDFFNLKNALEAGWSWSGLAGNFTVAVNDMHDGIEFPALKGVIVRYFRPLFLASLRVDHAVCGLHAWGYHLTNILLHLALVAVFYAVLRELLPDRPDMAWVGALLYGVLPFTVTIVAWVSGRTEQWPALAMMAGVWAWLRFAKTRTRGYYALTIAAMAVGLLAKENAVVFPGLVFAAWLWLAPRPRPSIVWFVPYVVLVAGYLVLRGRILGGFPLPPPMFYYHSPTEPGFVWWLLAKCICVFYALLTGLCLMYPAEMLLWRNPRALAVATVATVAVATLLFRFVRGRRDDPWRRLAYFAIAWIVITLAPTAPIFVAAIYFYFPLAGIVLLYLVIWQRLVECGRPRWLARRLWRQAVLAALIVLCMAWLQVGNAIFGLGSRVTRRLNDQLAEVAEPIDGARLYVIDLPPLASSAKIDLGLRRPECRFELHMFSVAPYIVKIPPTVSRVEQLDDRTLRVTALQKPYLSGVDALAASGDRLADPIHAGLILEAPGYRFEFTKVEPGGLFGRNCVRQYTVRFDEPLDRPGNRFIRYQNGRFERIDFGNGSGVGG